MVLVRGGLLVGSGAGAGVGASAGSCAVTADRARRRRSVMTAVLLPFLPFLLGGCDFFGGSARPPATIADQKDCFPEKSRDWIARTEEETVARTAAAIPSATLYIDRSASMAGYLAGATTVERPFQDIIGTVPQSLRELGARSTFRPFGLTLAPAMTDGSAMMQPAFFRCGSGAREGCESRLDVVLADVAAKPDDLAIIVSDLWFSNSDVDTSALAALKPHLASILGSRRAIAIYGFAAPFDGPIYDLPAVGERQPTRVQHRGRHPLYMMVIGKDAAVAAFRERLKRSGSPMIRDGVMPGGAIQQALFTASPTLEASLPRAPLSLGNAPQISAVPFDTFNGLHVQQFRYDGSMRPPSGQQPTYPSWTGPDRSLFAPNAVWEGPTQLRVRVWRKRNDACRRDSWTEINALPGEWPQIDSKAQTTFEMSPRLVRQALRQEGDYVLTGEVRRISINQEESPSMAWMQRWTLAYDGNGYRAPADTLFPTMNIVEFANIMRATLADEVEKNQLPVAGFTVLVRSGEE